MEGVGGVKMGVKTKKKKKSVYQKGKDAAKGYMGKKGEGSGKKRRRSPEYWAKRVLIERLKKKYWRAKYGGR